MSVQETLQDYIIGLQHIGHIVDDLEKAIAGFVALYGLGPDDIRRVPETSDGAPTLFAFITVADSEFELIQPVSEDSHDELRSVPSGGAGINHVAWRVSDVDACLQVAAANGVRPGHVTPNGVVSFGSKKFVYLNPGDCNGMLVELIEVLD